MQKKENGSADEPFWCLCYSGAGRDSVVSMPRPAGLGKVAGLHQSFHFRKNNGFLGKVNSITVWAGVLRIELGAGAIAVKADRHQVTA
ncbi:MAG: hypothetical protein WC633_07470 [Desulfurivibrionaceae bacterium]